MIWTKERYAEYLRSSHWDETRRMALDAAAGRCQRCNRGRRLEVHHRSYAHIGAERPQDLEVLCFGCHRQEHGTGVPPRSAPVAWNWEHIGVILPRVLAGMGFTITVGTD